MTQQPRSPSCSTPSDKLQQLQRGCTISDCSPTSMPQQPARVLLPVLPPSTCRTLQPLLLCQHFGSATLHPAAKLHPEPYIAHPGTRRTAGSAAARSAAAPSPPPAASRRPAPARRQSLRACAQSPPARPPAPRCCWTCRLQRAGRRPSSQWSCSVPGTLPRPGGCTAMTALRSRTGNPTRALHCRTGAQFPGSVGGLLCTHEKTCAPASPFSMLELRAFSGSDSSAPAASELSCRPFSIMASNTAPRLSPSCSSAAAQHQLQDGLLKIFRGRMSILRRGGMPEMYHAAVHGMCPAVRGRHLGSCCRGDGRTLLERAAHDLLLQGGQAASVHGRLQHRLHPKSKCGFVADLQQWQVAAAGAWLCSMALP